MMINKKIGIIGCGNMGEALLGRLAKVMEKSTSIMVSELDAQRRDYLQGKYKIIIETDNNVVVKYSDVIILAVKPKDFEPVLRQEVCCGVSNKKLLISIAAGITTNYIEEIVGKDVRVIRAMPNMPAVIGEGITALSRGVACDDDDMALAGEIFSGIGDVLEVKEDSMDAVTAVSGSGPAYICYFLAALIEGAKGLGLDSEVAKKLVLKTALGTAKLLNISDDSPDVVRAKVTSKGGTTEAAIKVLESKKADQIIKDALKAAENRSGELRNKK